jgi:hypothetical protein
MLLIGYAYMKEGLSYVNSNVWGIGAVSGKKKSNYGATQLMLFAEPGVFC